ncbi:lethal(3)malignant brain tumor-like protein 3 isoform X2 [Ochlerotatus camptorhynchus]
MQTPGFKLQIGNTNIMSLQQKFIGPLNQQQPQGPPSMTMIQPSPMSIPGPADLKRLPSSIKILKPIAPKPGITNYTSTVIKPAQESAIQAASPGASSVCHHVLPFGTTIKVTAGNEQLPIPISKSQQIIQPPSLIQQQAQLQPQQSQLSQMQPIQQPQSPQASALIKQIRPVSPATMSPQQSAVLSPNQNKVIINKIIYKPPESHLGPGPTAGQPRIVAATPPLSPVSLPDLKRKIIITNSANRKRLTSPAQSPTSIPQRTTSIQPTQTQIIVQAASPTLPLAPSLAAARTTIDNIPTTMHAVITSCSSSNITVTPMIVEPTVSLIQEERPQSTMEEEPKQPDELPESSEPSSDRENQSSFEEINKTISQSSSQVDASETEVSSTTTEQMMIGGEDPENKDESHDDELDTGEHMEMEMLESSQGSVCSEAVDDSIKMDEMEEENEVTKEDSIIQELKEGLHTPTKKQDEVLDELLEDQLKSPRLLKRANSDSQQVSSPVRARRLSEPPKPDEVPKEDDDILPMPKPLAIIKKTRKGRSSVSRRSRSSKTIHSSLLCNEKLETESDESRSIKTSASSLHTISPPKKEETSESPPAYDQDKLQAAIEMYKKKQSMVKSQSHREKSRSESRSVADREEKEEKDYIEGDFGSTPSDLIKWNDGIGYMRNSYLHFQFNQFGLVEPMEIKEYLKHVNTNVYETLKDPVASRTAVKAARKKRKTLNTDGSYHCKGCRGRGTAGDFATPEYCSIACMKKTKNESLLTSIEYSKSLQRKGIGSSESSASTSTPLPTSDDDSLGSSLNFANAFKEKNVIPPKESVPKTIVQEVQPTAEQPNQPKFAWEVYLSKTQGTPSPLNLFVNPYPGGPNKFRTGMKLEAIDPENNSLFCVCTIVEVRGYRLKLTFDGYSRDYDFWVNVDSLDIFPPGWCRKTGRVLQPPHGYDGDFSWMKYLTEKRAMPASRNLFTHLNSPSNENKFQIGMCLEADDLKKSGKVCAASITDKIDNRVLVHFDGWDERYDYWVDIHSPYIHHTDWHHENGYNITPPPDWNKSDFEWVKYIRLKSRRIGKAIIPADQSLFATRQPMEFKPGMKLEVVDRKNQMLIRPATVVATDGYEIKVCFDGWPNFYSFWIEDDSSDIHPMNWCKRTNHPIEFPPDHRPASINSSCEGPYCLGQGNAKILSKSYHTRLAECPYRTNNWLLEDRKKPRLAHEQVVTQNNFSTLQEPLPQEAPPAKKIKKELDEPLPAPNAHNPQSISMPSLGNVQKTTPSNGNTTTTLDPLLKTALPVIADFGPRLKQSYKLWKTSSRILDRCTDSMSGYDRNPLCWSVEDVASYVERFPGCTFVGNQVREEQINGTAFLSLTQEDLVKYLDVKLGPAIKLYNRIIHLRLEVEKHFIKF